MCRPFRSANRSALEDDENLKRPSPRVRAVARHWVVAKPHGLTYISSLGDACGADGLQRYEYEAGINEFAWRYIYASKEFVTWKDGIDPNTAPDFPEDPEIPVQFAQELDGFCGGSGLAPGSDIRNMEPLERGVWELKTPDLRLLGWFPARNYLILHKGELKRNLVRYADYRPLIDEVVRFRESLGAETKRFLVGRLSDVFSNRIGSVDRSFARFLGKIREAIQRTFAEEAERGLSQKEIADTLGVDQALISRRLNGPGNITLRTLSDLYTAMGREPLSNFVCPRSQMATVGAFVASTSSSSETVTVRPTNLDYHFVEATGTQETCPQLSVAA